MKVRTFGLMRERASQRTMVSRRTPQARPKAEVQLIDGEALIGNTPAKHPSQKICRNTKENRTSPSSVFLRVLWGSSISGLGLFGVVAEFVVDRAQAQDFEFALAVRSDHYGFIPDL